MPLQKVQVAGLEPSAEDKPTFYAIQIRGVDADGNPGPWSRELVFQSLPQFPPEVDDIVDTETITINPNDILIYTGTQWIGSPVLFDGTIMLSDGSKPFLGPVAGVDPVGVTDLTTKRYVDDSIGKVFDLLPTSGPVVLDFSIHTYLTHNLTGNVTYFTANFIPGRTIQTRISNTSGGVLSLTFPAGWSFNGARPTSIANNAVGLLTLRAFGTADNLCVATYQVT